MKKMYLLMLLFVSNAAFSQILYQESFETNTNGTNYNTSITEFTDGNSDFFLRTDGSDIASNYDVTNIDGSFYFAGMDIDAGGPLPAQLSTILIDVTGLTEVDFSILLAEDDDGTNQDWDENDYFHITYSIDGGARQNLIWVENDGSTFNSKPLIDTDFDGQGDGVEITSVFTEFTENITLLNATNIQFFFEANLDSGDEDIAFDNIVVSEVSIDPTIITSASTVSGFLQFDGTPSTEKSVDVSGINLTGDVTVAVNSGDYQVALTSGGTFGNSVTITFMTPTLAATPIYIRLNGSGVADPSNGNLLITSAGAADSTVTLEGEITAPAPTITVSKTTITGFSHFVGTPSEADSFNVEGFNLTADMIISAPTNFEISTALVGTYGPTVTIPYGTGTVASTKVYVRLNGPSMNLNQTGDVTVASTGATNKIVALTGETLDYIVSTIGDVTGIDPAGVGTSIGEYVKLTGVVHCDNFKNNGYDLTIIDTDNDGINLFSFNNVDGYTPTEGDKLIVEGQISQFNGMLQINPVSIVVDASGQALQTATAITILDELSESQYVSLASVTTVNGETMWPSNGNVDVTDGTTTFTVRIPTASPLAGIAIPNGPFSLTGVGNQFDNSTPYNSGYQMFPCGVVSLCNVDVATSLTDATITATSTPAGLTYEWVNCADTSVIVGETGASFTATVSGDYAVIVTEGPCSDMSACVTVNIVGLTENEFEGISVYPNPVNDILNISNENETIESVKIISTTGSVVYFSTVSSSKFLVNTAKLNAGVYFVNVKTLNGVKTYKVIK